MQKTIFTKYFTMCATLIIVSITILGALFMAFASQYFKEDKYKLLRTNIERAAAATQEQFANPTNETTIRLVSLYGAIAQTIDATIFLTDDLGHTIVCTELSPCKHTLYAVPQDVLSALAKSNEYAEMGKLGSIYSDHNYTVGVPVRVEGNDKTAYLFASTGASIPLSNFMGEMLKIFMISAVAVLILTFIIVYFVSIQMAKPLREMSLAAQKFGRGEFDTRLSVNSYDETGQLALALNNMAQSLSTLESMSRSFIANVSHELKTPMTSIGGFIDGILDGTIEPERQRHYLMIVSEEVRRLTRVVKTMLNLARLEAGEMQINKSQINIVDIICQTVFTFEQQIDIKKLEIIGLDHDKVLVEADADLIHQVVYNLTENAVKFVNDGGYLEFSFSVEMGKTYVSIKNSGEGLSKEEIPKLFDRFYKTDKSRGLDKNGVGLGLYIVRSIINLHGGDVIVRSVQGEYAEFVFSLESCKPQGKSQIKADIFRGRNTLPK